MLQWPAKAQSQACTSETKCCFLICHELHQVTGFCSRGDFEVDACRRATHNNKRRIWDTFATCQSFSRSQIKDSLKTEKKKGKKKKSASILAVSETV